MTYRAVQYKFLECITKRGKWLEPYNIIVLHAQKTTWVPTSDLKNKLNNQMNNEATTVHEQERKRGQREKNRREREREKGKERKRERETKKKRNREKEKKQTKRSRERERGKNKPMPDDLRTPWMHIKVEPSYTRATTTLAWMTAACKVNSTDLSKWYIIALHVGESDIKRSHLWRSLEPSTSSIDMMSITAFRSRKTRWWHWAFWSARVTSHHPSPSWHGTTEEPGAIKCPSPCQTSTCLSDHLFKTAIQYHIKIGSDGGWRTHQRISITCQVPQQRLRGPARGEHEITITALVILQQCHIRWHKSLWWHPLQLHKRLTSSVTSARAWNLLNINWFMMFILKQQHLFLWHHLWHLNKEAC